LLGDEFLVLYGDTYLRIDYAAVDRAAASERGLMTVLRNEGVETQFIPRKPGRRIR